MKSFEPKSLAIFGRLPALSVAELESVYGAEHIRPVAGAGLMDIPTEEIVFSRLGGTVKLAKVLNILPTTHWPDLEKYLAENVPKHLQHLPDGTFTLGLSLYNFEVSETTINRSLLSLKKVIRATGRSVRVVPNKTPQLNSAQVLHNKLTTKGAWELLLLKDGEHTILAQSIFVQDITAYGRRDHGRPKRDARVGMLPPKLAQTILNLAAGPTTPAASTVVVDPFCGTGVMLQEALLMGFSAYGSDIEPRMIDYSNDNLNWLGRTVIREELAERFRLEVADATEHHWQPPLSIIASETYLGRPFSALPPTETLNKVVRDVDTIHKKFFRNLASQLQPGTRLCLAVPAWQHDGRLTRLPVLDHLTDMGYNYLDLKHVGRDQLVYQRENQIVVRQLVILEKN